MLAAFGYGRRGEQLACSPWLNENAAFNCRFFVPEIRRSP
jgi:hypothetical protein